MLLKACLISSGLLSVKINQSLSDQLRVTFPTTNWPEDQRPNVGLEVQTWCELPVGGGCGSNGILGTAILAALRILSGEFFSRQKLIYKVRSLQF